MIEISKPTEADRAAAKKALPLKCFCDKAVGTERSNGYICPPHQLVAEAIAKARQEGEFVQIEEWKKTCDLLRQVGQSEMARANSAEAALAECRADKNRWEQQAKALRMALKRVANLITPPSTMVTRAYEHAEFALESTEFMDDTTDTPALPAEEPDHD